MDNKYEVNFEELMKIRRKSLRTLKFRTTEDIESSDRLIGQERAEKAMDFGVNIKEKGYNIYISGKSGSGRTYYAKKLLGEIAVSHKISDDFCYIYNFGDRYSPTAISFPAGFGKIFRQDMEYLLNEVIKRIPVTFNSEEYDRQKNEILEGYHDTKNSLIDELNHMAEVNNLEVKATSTGFAFVPIVNGKPLGENEYDSINGDLKERIQKNVAEMRIKALDILRRVKAAEKVADGKVKRLDNEIGLYLVENLIDNFKNKYSTNEDILKYFEYVKKDIIENLGIFINGIDKHALNKEEEELLSKYMVNLIVDNSNSKGAPVIYEPNPTYNNLMGNVEYESKSGSITTDFLLIRAGSILKANGGFLIVNVHDILKNFQAFDGLKRVLKSAEIQIEGIRSQLDLLTISSIKPQAIPVNIKVILIGTEYFYQLLYEHDDEFYNLFKIKVDFDGDMEKNDENVYKIAQFISDYCSKNNIRHLDNPAVGAVIEYCSKLAGGNKRLSTCLEKVIDILNESNIWAEVSQNKYISRNNIKKALLEKEKRVNLIEEKILRQYGDKKLMLSVMGEAVGQINGLSVIEAGGHSFGKPYRITATTYMGKSGIINIEREAQMSGNIHNKSVMIISGYIGSKYARSIPLSISAHICFEQLYGFIDGDSASLAELYAILSSLSEIPLKQNVAITGSLNQMGEVQPVGGVNEKIEGFYRVCSLSGLNGSHGVILPQQNINDLLLEDDIMADIKKGLFHIYAIKSVEEGIELLTGMKCGIRNEKSEFEEKTFNYYVNLKMKEFIMNYNTVSELKHNDNGENKKL